MWVQFLEGPPPQIWEGKNTSKIQRDFRQLSTLIVNVSGMHRRVESLKKLDQLQPIPRWAKKIR